MPIRVLIVDDYPVTRAGLSSALGGVADITVVGEAADGHEALRLIKRLEPDVVLLDCQLPGLDGVQVGLEVQRQRLSTKVLAFTAYDDDRYVYGMLQVGAVGYLLKGEPPETVVAAVRGVARGQRHYSQPILARLTAWAQGTWAALPQRAGFTSREIDVLRLMAKGMDNTQIASALTISEHTVKFHVGNIYTKLGVRSRGEAIVAAFRCGLVKT